VEHGMATDYISTKEIYDQLYEVIRSQRFLEKQGLGNEIPFFICPYSPSYQVEIEQIQKQLINQLKHTGVTILSINLYDEAVKLLHERKIWNRIINTEASLDKNNLKDLLRNVLDPETHFIPRIASLIQENEHHVMFLSGVGEIYPYIRSHTILNNLQSTAKHQPTVMFFPGTYTHSLQTGASLDLFGRLRDDKYYRAFNILHYNV
jgi:hypothetical protein